MQARFAQAESKERKAGAAIRHAGAGERSGVIAGPAFSQLEHIDTSITNMYVFVFSLHLRVHYGIGAV